MRPPRDGRGPAKRWPGRPPGRHRATRASRSRRRSGGFAGFSAPIRRASDDSAGRSENERPAPAGAVPGPSPVPSAVPATVAAEPDPVEEVRARRTGFPRIAGIDVGFRISGGTRARPSVNGRATDVVDRRTRRNEATEPAGEPAGAPAGPARRPRSGEPVRDHAARRPPVLPAPAQRRPYSVHTDRRGGERPPGLRRPRNGDGSAMCEGGRMKRAASTSTFPALPGRGRLIVPAVFFIQRPTGEVAEWSKALPC